MGRLLKIVAGLAALGACVAVAGYLFILPQLGRTARALHMTDVTGDVERGRYLVTAGGCVACHTDLKNKGKLLAGGPALKSPFGTFYAPNITSDQNHGIGGWSLDQFARAMIAGIAPSGQHYFPSFPYTSYAGMTPKDLADIKSYLDTVEAVAQPAREHDLLWPFSDRSFVAVWKEFYFSGHRFEEDNSQDGAWNRGAYLVNVLGHCGECHTQRNFLGGTVGVPLAGNSAGPEGSKVPGIRGLTTRDKPWTKDDLILSLQVGMVPSGDFLGGTMAEMVAHSTGKLTDADRQAITAYLASLTE